MTYASNAVGTITDVAEITRMAHSVGALVWVDAVHYGPHGLIDVQALGVDFLVCSAYKFFGPHLGILYGKEALLERLHPYQLRPAPHNVPDKFETGTKKPRVHGGAGGHADYLSKLGGQGKGISREALKHAMERRRCR